MTFPSKIQCCSCFTAYCGTVLQVIVSESSHEDEDVVNAKRSKAEEEVVYHPVKLSRSDLYRPPTAEELNQLKEAESLFHCSLLKMQVRPLS